MKSILYKHKYNLIKRTLMIILCLVIMTFTWFTSYQEAYANPIIYPVLEGALYLAGTLMAACGINICDETDTESIKQTKLAIVANAFKNVLLKTTAEKLLWQQISQEFTPGVPYQFTEEGWNVAKSLVMRYVNDIHNPEDGVKIFDNLASGLDLDYYLIHQKDYYEFNIGNEESPSYIDDYEIIPFSANNHIYMWYLQNINYGDQHKVDIWMERTGTMEVTVHKIDYNLTQNTQSELPPVKLQVGIENVGWCLQSSLGQYYLNSQYYYLSSIRINLVHRYANGEATISNHFLPDFSTNFVYDIATNPTEITLQKDPAIKLDASYTIPPATINGEKKPLTVVPPPTLADFGTKVKSVADVVPQTNVENPAEPTTGTGTTTTNMSSADKSWWQTVVGGVTGILGDIKSWLDAFWEKMIAALAGALAPVMTQLQTIDGSITGVRDAVAEADLTDTIKDYKIPDLFILSLKVILATIRMVGRAIVFIGTLQKIPPDGSMVPENMVTGLNYAKNYKLPIGISIWDLTSLIVGYLFGLNVFKRVVRTVRRST